MASRNFIIYLSMLIVAVGTSTFACFLKYFIDNNTVPEMLKRLSKFQIYMFTLWNFTFQIVFLVLAVSDELAKLAGLSILQKQLEKLRINIFSTIVLPSSILVMSVFWIIWHIDRELIFPKAIDEFYPSWLNHTLHTFIIIPLIIEIIVQRNNKNYQVSRTKAGLLFALYCTIYQILYLSVYLKHGVWLYPIYKVLTWSERFLFCFGQLIYGLIYQQIGITLLTSSSAKIKTK